ncbi:MAG: hypothetical protein KGL03_05965 [Nitrospirota bacterium]|nr:hypothetical protein [Nitrospirota bacterium]MDE3224273.1 hypothetical protein [Nitrospirota bacterium]
MPARVKRYAGMGIRGCAMFALLAGQVACVSIQMALLTKQTYPPTPASEPIEVLETDPNRAYIRLAQITATSESAEEETLRDRILARARQLGADAVVLGKADYTRSLGPSPLFESTLSPAGVSSSPYWGGWWNPFYLDAWSFEQASADQARWTLYLSGLAIRYVRQAPSTSQPRAD